ncbi:MAG TPA: WcbI family polysaccharide biosynthesis putative acetyltransferase [Alphaproteobacteria bacterium]|nr:WcbI family polysaccharide biosynthesis putative acetyltransferase [Alphaproteobacteria bacterium]
MKIFVISTCQGIGVADAIRNMTENAQVHDLTVGEANAKDDAFYADQLSNADHIFALASFEPRPRFAGIKEKITLIPNVLFNAYHPDLTYLLYRGAPVRGVLSGLHSAIAFAAFRRGLGVDATLGLYHSRNYQAFGYFEMWESSKKSLFRQFHVSGLPMQPHFYRWCRSGSFMYTTNHPKIAVLSDIAAEALRRIGVSPVRQRAEIVDPLRRSAIFPVYEEIAERYCAAGSYRFKPHGISHTMSLRDFIAQSFEVYRPLVIEEVVVHPAFARNVERIDRRLW